MKKIKIIALWTILYGLTTSGFSTNSDTLYVSPNPFDSITVIHFDIFQNDTISLDIYNMVGKNVRTYFQNAVLPSGSYLINFLSDTLPNSLYFVVLKINSTKTLSAKAIKTTLGINENEIVIGKQLIYPNPTTGLLTIPYNGKKAILVTDLNGRMVKSLTLNSNNVSLLDLNNGTYIVTILTGNRQIFSNQKIQLIK